MVRAVTRADKPAYLYLFTWTEARKRARLGAYHGEELTFLSDSFPTKWGSSKDDEAFGVVIRTYWTEFAKTGNPNFSGFPNWPAYDPRSDQLLELGRSIRLTGVSPKLRVLERIMAPILANKPAKQLRPNETNTHTD